MTKRQAMRLLGATNQSELATALGISRQAVSSWPDTLPREIELRILGTVFKSTLDRLQEPAI